MPAEPDLSSVVGEVAVEPGGDLLSDKVPIERGGGS